MSKKLPWFSARLLFEARDSAQEPALFEERLVLVKSESGIGGAERKAQKLAMSLTERYDNAAGETVTWKFVEVLDLVQLNETDIHEGSEVYHHYLRSDEVEQIRESLKAGSIS